MAKRIVAVVEESESIGGAHRHVGWMHLSDGTTVSRTQAVAYVRAGLERFEVNRGEQAIELQVLRCPRCGTEDLQTADGVADLVSVLAKADTPS